MIDALNLNPAKVKKMLVEKGYTVYGRFSDKNTGTARNRYPMNSSTMNLSTPAAVPTC